MTAAGVSETLVTIPISDADYRVEDFAASESGTVYIVFRRRASRDTWIVRVGSDRKAIDHRSGEEVKGPFTSQAFRGGFFGNDLAISSAGQDYVLTHDTAGSASDFELNLEPAGAALQSLGKLTNVYDIEFIEGQLWGARTPTQNPPTELVKIALPSLAVESKGNYAAARPILKAGSAVFFGAGEVVEVALDTFAATVRKWQEVFSPVKQNYATTTKGKCPPITVTTIGNIGRTPLFEQPVEDEPDLNFIPVGGTPPYTYSASGSLPPGLSLGSNSAGAFLTGTLTRHGTYTFTITATDSMGCTGGTTVTFKVRCPAFYNPTETLSIGAEVGKEYNGLVRVNRGDKVRIVKGLPPGLTAPREEREGELQVRGNPTHPGRYEIQVEVTNRLDPECKFTKTILMFVGNSPMEVSQSKVGPKEADSIHAVDGSETAKALNAILEEPAQLSAPTGRLGIESGNELYATAVISYRQKGVIVSEAAVPVSPPTTRSRFFLDYRTGVPSGTGKVDVYTGFAAVNRGNSNASMTLRLRDSAGAVLASGTATLAAGAHIAKFVNQIPDIAPDFKLPADFATTTRFATLELESDQPISVVALRLTINQRGDLLLTSTPGADLTQPAVKGTLYFPQLADGGGWQTALILLNTTDATIRGALRIFDDNGAPLSVKMESGESGSEHRYSIAPGGFVRLATDGSPASVRPGSVQLVPDDGGSAPAAAGIFSLVQAGTLTTESGVPAVPSTTRARIYVDRSAGHDTGIAVAAAGAAAVDIRAEVFGSDANVPVATGTVRLAANGHAAKFAPSLVTGTLADGFTGVLEISAPTPFAALTLRSLTNERGDFLITTLPVADMTRAAPAPMVFPQVVVGGGYTTEFVLLNAGTTEKQVQLRFFDQTGKPAAVSTLVVSSASGSP